MDTVNKQTFLNGLESQVDQQLTQVIQVFQNLTDDQLVRPSATGGWSICECLEHLISYGQYYQPRLQEQLGEKGAKSDGMSFKPGWLGQYFIGMMDPAKSRKQYKAAKRHQPTVSRPSHQTVAAFIDQQEELLALLRQAGGANLGRIRIPVSVAPFLTMNAGDTLHFLIVHNQRHLQQAMRNCN
nr:DinB family protein [uncultured Arsenicibacter sp.]